MGAGVDSSLQFTLVPGCWYGLSMFPGYGDCPYHSPIRVDSIQPLGGRQFELGFFNLCYAAGVQSFRQRLQTLFRGDRHLVAQVAHSHDRLTW